MALIAGQNLGPYQIVSAAGAGGMGEVYKAKDTRLERTVAIKILPTISQENVSLRQRFEREAKSISSLNHPNICTLFDVGHQDGIDYLVMEYLEGETLSSRLSKGPIPQPELFTLSIQIADALDNAHRQGLVHRDLKPGNIMLTKTGAKLMDFGLAKLHHGGGLVYDSDRSTRTTPLTGEGAIIGTLQYMSPEQLEGKEADQRSDIFAFGAVLYEMATGQKAFKGSSQASLIAAIMDREPTPLSHLQPLAPTMLEWAIRQCLAKDPDQRWQSAGDLKQTLSWIGDGDSQLSLPAGVVLKRRAREKILFIISAVLLLTLAVIASLYIFSPADKQKLVISSILPPKFADIPPFNSIAISPDGSTLAFIAYDSSKNLRQLWVRRLDSPVSIPITGEKWIYSPFWSPDSKTIGYLQSNKLKKISATGGQPQTICDSANAGSWNEDGVIIFASITRGGSIYRVSAAGGKVEPITALDSTFQENRHRYAQFLPDGEHFLFRSVTERSSGSEKDAICVGSLTSKVVKRLFHSKSNFCYSDGHILYVQEGTLMALPFDAGSLSISGDPLTVAENVVYNTTGGHGTFSVSDEGTLIYAQGTYERGGQLLVVDRNGNPLDTMVEQEFVGTFKLSPDESMVAYESLDSINNTFDIWVLDITSGIQTRITTDSSEENNPLWSPDGSQIIYSVSDNQHIAIYLKEVFGTDTAQLLFETTDSTMWRIDPDSWSSDGKHVMLFALSEKSKGDVWVLPLVGEKKPFPYVATNFNEGWIQFSPDGRWVAFTSDESGEEEVYVAPFPKPTRKVRVSIKGGINPQWNRLGTQLYYMDPNEDKIMTVDVNGSGANFKVDKVRELFKGNFWGSGNRYQIFSDEKKFLIKIRPGEDFDVNLILVQNWTELLKK